MAAPTERYIRDVSTEHMCGTYIDLTTRCPTPPFPFPTYHFREGTGLLRLLIIAPLCVWRNPNAALFHPDGAAKRRTGAPTARTPAPCAAHLALACL